jgi:hypothetical protein
MFGVARFVHVGGIRSKPEADSAAFSSNHRPHNYSWLDGVELMPLRALSIRCLAVAPGIGWGYQFRSHSLKRVGIGIGVGGGGGGLSSLARDLRRVVRSAFERVQRWVPIGGEGIGPRELDAEHIRGLTASVAREQSYPQTIDIPPLTDSV